MAQEKMLMGAGAFVDLNGADIGAAGRVVVLLPKASPSGAAAQFRDLPEELRRQLGVVDGPAGHGFLTAVGLAPPSGLSERPAVRYLLVVQGDLSRPLAGEVISPVDRNAGHGDNVLRFHDEKVVSAPENVGGDLVELRNMFLRIDAAAFVRAPGAPFADKEQFGKNAVLDLGTSGVVFVPDDADTLVEKLLGNIRADEHGAPYSDGSRRSPYAVQVLIDDPAMDAKAYNPISPGAKAAGAGAERESTRRGVGGDNLSAVLGIIAASSAVTAVATGAVGPAVAFGFFLVMLGGVVTAMAAVRGH